MASTYSERLRFELIGDGEQSGSWGATTNTNLGTLIEQAIAGVSSVTHDDTANYTLTAANGTADEARNAVLVIGGTLTSARNVVCPTQQKLYLVKNNTAGGFAVTIKTASGTGAEVPNGESMYVFCDGTNVVDAITAFSILDAFTKLVTPLVTSTGTLALEAEGSNAIRLLTDAAERVRVAADGKVGIGTDAPTSQLTVAGAADKLVSVGGTSFSIGGFTKQQYDRDLVGTVYKTVLTISNGIYLVTVGEPADNRSREVWISIRTGDAVIPAWSRLLRVGGSESPVQSYQFRTLIGGVLQVRTTEVDSDHTARLEVYQLGA